MSTEADRTERGPTSPARDGAQAAAKSPGLRRLAAAGLLGYAAIHLLVGWLAFSLAWLQASPGRGERPTDSSGALALVAQTPAGGALLWAIAAALAGLCAWQAVEVLRHHRRLPPPGRRRRGALVQTVKTVGTAVFYGWLAWSAAGTALGHGADRASQRRTVSGVLSWPGGRVLVLAIAVAVAVIGMYLVQKGIRSQFVDELAHDRFSPAARTAVHRISQVGFALKGVALVLVGVVVGWAAVTSRPEKGAGLDSTLRTIATEPFGRWLLTVIALGLAAFAVYCLARARHPVG